MDYNRIKNIYNEALDDTISFADKADYLNEKPKQQFLEFKLKMFKQRIDSENKREAFIRKAANRFFQLSLKEMKRELREKVKRRRQEMVKMRLLTELQSGNEITPIENTTNCETCAHCHFDETTCSLCCEAYNLSFTSEEMYMQFCKCFCNAYTIYEAPTETTADEAVEQPISGESTDGEPTDEIVTTTSETPNEQASECTEEKQPYFCKECSSCIIDENGQCYCDKYDVDLDQSDADSVCCCECNGFFEESEE